jgi:RNA polymerase sigma-70 factor (ECF subfamily)
MVKTNTTSSTSANTAQSATSAPASAAEDLRRRRRFDVVYDAHAGLVYRFCLRLTAGRTADAEDLTQEVMVAAYQGLPRFAGRSAIRVWLYRIAVYRWRVLRDATARANAGQGGHAGAALLPLDPAGDTSLPHALRTPDLATATDTRLSLEAALSALSDPLREAFLLVKSEGLTHREAARILDAPQGTVQSRVHEAVKRLRVLLADDFPTHTECTEKTEKTDDPTYR